ncbi:hypothetical protein I4U23_024794 [Adineta vaga]|nr:hypothetical protein I4U23_024794 [Adineta vaga]
MVSFDEIFSYLRIVLFALIFFIALIYTIPIICISQFHHSHMILTLNICVATALCSLYWLLFYIMLMLQRQKTYRFMINSCVFVCIFPTILTLLVPFSLVTASINRYFCVKYYTKTIYKKKRWIFICILTQWIFTTLLSLPTLAGIESGCVLSRWVDIYKLVVIAILPCLMFLFTNILMYNNVRSSTTRIQPLASASQYRSSNEQQMKINRRDVHLLRHMIIMFSIFIGGWTPLYVLLAFQPQFSINPVLLSCLTIWCQLALLCDIIDLFLYNHQLRKYLRTIFLRNNC